MVIDTGKVIHSMTAHLDSVTSLAVDPHGLYLLSGGELSFYVLMSPVCFMISFNPPTFSLLSLSLPLSLSLSLSPLPSSPFLPVSPPSLLTLSPPPLFHSGHDGSLRFWSMDSKMCIQEITAHRKRYDESIYNVACHLSKPYFASAGADSIAKVFV